MIDHGSVVVQGMMKVVLSDDELLKFWCLGGIHPSTYKCEKVIIYLTLNKEVHFSIHFNQFLPLEFTQFIFIFKQENIPKLKYL